MKQINIAFCNRPSYNNPIGGDAIQMLKTKEWLENLYGLQISIITNPHELTENFDIIHVFNFATYEITNGFMEKAHNLGIPIVSSCIYWDYSYAIPPLHYLLLGYPTHISFKTVCFYRFLYQNITSFLKKPIGVSHEFRNYVRKFINYSDYILPNSIEEGKLLLQFAGLKKEDKIRVIYNGTEFQNNEILSHNDFFSKYNIPENYVLQVGRIEYIKNQLNLLYALKDQPQIPIVFIGQTSDKKYANKLHNLAKQRGNVYFFNKIPHHEISSFYHYAAIHVLLSLRESPGLVSLEAASEGCPIVISSKEFLPKDTYFPNASYSVNPLKITEIKEILLKAYQEKKSTIIDNSKFSWSNVAKQTYQVYEEILKTKKEE